MAHDHTRVNLAIWGDDDFTDLSPAAQHLYFVLWTSAGRSYCGAGNWHPGRIAQLAHGWTIAHIERAAEELSTQLFLIIDTLTDEWLLRSWVKHDGLWRTPNMAVSVANARADLASKTLRGVVVHEAQKLVRAYPESTSWTRPAVAEMLRQKAIDAATLEPFRAAVTPAATPHLTPIATPGLTPAATPALRVNPNPPVNPPSNPPSTTATTTATATSEGYVTGERNVASACTPGDAPSPRCPTHLTDAAPGPCGPCGDARREYDRWRTDNDDRIRREAAEARRAEREAEATTKAAAITECDLCDDNGYRGVVVCDHVDHAPAAARGRAKIQAELDAIAARKAS